MGTTSIRFTGLASGLDTDSMVQAMSMPQQIKVDAAKTQKQLLELKKDAWKEMNKKIWDFHTKVLNDLRLEATFRKTNVTVSNPNAIELDKNIKLPEGNHTIQVENMATGATVSSKKIIDANGKSVDKKTTLESLKIANGTTIEVDTDDGVPVQISIQKVEYKDEGGNTQYRDMTLADLEKQLSTKLNGKGFNCKFDEKAGAFIINSKTTGQEQTIKLESTSPDGSDALAKLGFIPAKDQDGIGTGQYNYTGKDAKIIYNGGIEVTSSTNNFEVNGIKFTVKGESTTPVTISSTQDTEAIIDFVKNFVEKYNELIEEMDTLVSAPKNKSYQPLTSEQKEAMTDEEIKLWDEKVKEGLLSGDPVLKDMLSSMRSILGGVVEGNTYSNLTEIGIKTGNWKEKGKLYIDEDKLRATLDKDKDAVINLLAGSGSAKVLYEKENIGSAWENLDDKVQKEYTEKNKDKLLGIGDRIYNAMNERSKSSKVKSANTFYNDKILQKNILEYDEKISVLEERLEKMEDMYYKKFSAMEKMMSQLNSQSTWLTSQMGGA